jgi:hypothetical protein
MANNFRNINYGRMLYESLRNYYSLNSSEQITILYKLCAAILSPLQPAFDDYVKFRTKEALIASCKWQIAQLTNVLNYLYDTALSRIYITQGVLMVVSDVTFAYLPINNDGTFAMAPNVQEHEFGDRSSQTLVTINIPSGVNLSDITATIEQIRMQGIPYKINTF